MLAIVRGCTHGKCKFCDIYFDEDFEMLPIEEIEADLDEIAKTTLPTEYRINLVGGNPYALSVKQLEPIIKLTKEKIPHIKSFGGFCRIADIKSKSDEDLKLLAELGVNDLSIGAESGWDPALSFMVKGHNAEDVAEQGRRLHEAGIDFTYFYLAGMAGAGKGQENALASAEVYSKAAPEHILVVSITPCQNWPLSEDIAKGRWIPPTETEIALEIRTFIEHLDCDTYVNCSHDTDIIRFEGKIPKDQKNMLTLMDNRIPMMNPKAARRMREMLHKATF